MESCINEGQDFLTDHIIWKAVLMKDRLFLQTTLYGKLY